MRKLAKQVLSRGYSPFPWENVWSVAGPLLGVVGGFWGNMYLQGRGVKLSEMLATRMIAKSALSCGFEPEDEDEFRFYSSDFFFPRGEGESPVELLEEMFFNVPRNYVGALVGDSGCGKTELLKQFCEDRINDGKPTLFVSFAHFNENPDSGKVKLNGKKVDVDVLDNLYEGCKLLKERSDEVPVLIVEDVVNNGEVVHSETMHASADICESGSLRVIFTSSDPTTVFVLDEEAKFRNWNLQEAPMLNHKFLVDELVRHSGLESEKVEDFINSEFPYGLGAHPFIQACTEFSKDFQVEGVVETVSNYFLKKAKTKFRRNFERAQKLFRKEKKELGENFNVDDLHRFASSLNESPKEGVEKSYVDTKFYNEFRAFAKANLLRGDGQVFWRDPKYEQISQEFFFPPKE